MNTIIFIPQAPTTKTESCRYRDVVGREITVEITSPVGLDSGNVFQSLPADWERLPNLPESMWNAYGGLLVVLFFFGAALFFTILLLGFADWLPTLPNAEGPLTESWELLTFYWYVRGSLVLAGAGLLVTLMVELVRSIKERK